MRRNEAERIIRNFHDETGMRDGSVKKIRYDSNSYRYTHTHTHAQVRLANIVL